MTYLDTDTPLARAVTDAIHGGDTGELRRLLSAHPELVTVRLGDEGGMSRTLLHVLTDWPGNFPNGPETARLLVEAGADVDGRFEGPHRETPLMWAASCDDIGVLDALLDAGADIEARGAVIADGTAISDACAFAQWNAARRLLARGATTNLWESAALGLMDRIAAAPPLTREDATTGLWAACHGGSREAAEYFLAHGADLNWIGYDHLTPLDAARRSGAEEVAGWLATRGGRPAAELV
ncbi:ankyrin repeat domain-containing protein [Sphaerisporangium aureirubrum]|uniref:Ankyrin repeat domain-containing protein n=1 Tax=Sphaerisporangium aureirubrum TaxID=1544736 RepID=A0ABW1NDH2_9ACTN